MKRINPTAMVVVGVVLFVFCVMGLLNAKHVAALIMYAVLLPCSVVSVVVGAKRRRSERTIAR